MSTVHYRQAKRADVPAMARIRAATWGTEDYWRLRIKAYLDCEHHPRHALKPRISYLALEGDSCVGLIAGHLTQRHGCHGELEWIDVIVEYRRKGIGSHLLRRLAKWFVEQDVTRVCVDVDPNNTLARHFYARHGADVLNEHWLMWRNVGLLAGQ